MAPTLTLRTERASQRTSTYARAQLTHTSTAQTSQVNYYYYHYYYTHGKRAPDLICFPGDIVSNGNLDRLLRRRRRVIGR